MDRSEADFNARLAGASSRLRDALVEFRRESRDYSELGLSNEPCNLRCSYCVQQRAFPPEEAPHRRSGLPVSERIAITLSVVDQFLERKTAGPSPGFGLSFNGGEILLDWPFVVAVVEHVSRRYPFLRPRYDLNSNMTQMTAEMAQFLARHSFNVHPSIDGDRRAHDRHRRYANGRGTHHDVLERVALYNRHAPAKPIVSFQATLASTGGFNAAGFLGLSRHGFRAARLGPHLLGTPPEEAVRMARIIGRLHARSPLMTLRVSDGYFRGVTTALSSRSRRFLFYCNGLSGLPARGLQFNITTLRLSHACPFVPQAGVPWEAVGGNIYHPLIGEASLTVFRKRIDALRDLCRGCEIVGICRGGCIMTGLTSTGERNAAACAYQRELWHVFAMDLARRQIEADRQASSPDAKRSRASANPQAGLRPGTAGSV